MKICPLGSELLHADGQTNTFDEAIVAFRSCTKSPKDQAQLDVSTSSRKLVFAVLGPYTAHVGSWVQTFQDNVSVPSSWFKPSKERQ